MMKTAPAGFHITLALMTALVVLPAYAEAQNRGGRPQNRQEMEQRVRRQMGRMIEERLSLDDAQAEALSNVVRGLEGRRHELRRAEMAVRRRVEAFMLESGVEDAEAQQLLTRMIELRAEEAQLYAEEQEALLEVLSPVQVLQLQSLREDLGQRIRSLMDGNGPSSRRRGGARDSTGWLGTDVSLDEPLPDLWFPG